MPIYVTDPTGERLPLCRKKDGVYEFIGYDTSNPDSVLETLDQLFGLSSLGYDNEGHLHHHLAYNYKDDYDITVPRDKEESDE